jgi:hypothetical protein
MTSRKLFHDVDPASSLATERIGRRIARASDEEMARTIEGLNEIIGA